MFSSISLIFSCLIVAGTYYMSRNFTKQTFRTIISHFKMHTKCRNSEYPRSAGIIRFSVPDDKVSWKVPFAEYLPVEYTAKHITGQPWADLDINELNAKWNELDNGINRVSHDGIYEILEGRPLNLHGRTGITGRGCLGRWGPNHACDPIVTRWKRGGTNEITVNSKTNLPVLQFVAIQRRDCKEWAIPGGMVDPGEVVSATLMREFSEEALNSLEKKDQVSEELIKTFFANGQEIYKGYVDDPRNTDNAWMETVAYNFHDSQGTTVGKLPLQAGDDAQNVRWTDLHGDIQLYASHRDLLQRVADLLKAHW